MNKSYVCHQSHKSARQVVTDDHVTIYIGDNGDPISVVMATLVNCGCSSRLTELRSVCSHLDTNHGLGGEVREQSIAKGAGLHRSGHSSFMG